MKMRPLGKTGIKVSEVGLGTWQMGGTSWGKMDDKTAQEILQTAVEQGINFFDTADIYGDGISEERIGKFLKGRSEKIFVATKWGRFPQPGWPKNYSFYNLQTQTDNSLRRLGVEALDLTQVHCLPTEYLRKAELFEWFNILKERGKIKNFGFSVESVEQAMLCLEHEGVASLQIIFNVFRQNPLTDLFAKAKEKGVALIIRLPLASGLLSGKFTEKTRFVETDHRHFNRDGQAFNVGETFSGVPFTQGLRLVDELKSWVPKGMTLPQMAMRWILDFEAVSVVIPGATKPQQIKENAFASSLPPLSPELHQKLKDFYENTVVQHIRGAY